MAIKTKEQRLAKWKERLERAQYWFGVYTAREDAPTAQFWKETIEKLETRIAAEEG